MKLASENGFTLLHPFEDPDVIAGQGTCAVEFCEQYAHEYGLSKGPDVPLIPTEEGSGCWLCLVTKARFKNTKIYAVEQKGTMITFCQCKKASEGADGQPCVAL